MAKSLIETWLDNLFKIKWTYYAIWVIVGVGAAIPLGIVGSDSLGQFTSGTTKTTCTVSSRTYDADGQELAASEHCVVKLVLTADGQTYSGREMCYNSLWTGQSREGDSKCASFFTSSELQSRCFTSIYAAGTTHTCWVDSSKMEATIKRSPPVEIVFNMIHHGFLTVAVLMDFFELFWPNNLVIPQQQFWKRIVNPLSALHYFQIAYHTSLVCWSNCLIWGGMGIASLYYYGLSSPSDYVGSDCDKYATLVLAYGIIDLLIGVFASISCLCTLLDGSPHLSLVPLGVTHKPKDAGWAGGNPNHLYEVGVDRFIRHKFFETGTIREKIAIAMGTVNAVLCSWPLWILHIIAFCVQLYGWVLFDGIGDGSCDIHFQYETMWIQAFHFYYYMGFLGIWLLLLVIVAPLNLAFDYVFGGKDRRERILAQRRTAAGLRDGPPPPELEMAEVDEDQELAMIPGSTSVKSIDIHPPATQPVQPTAKAEPMPIVTKQEEPKATKKGKKGKKSNVVDDEDRLPPMHIAPQPGMSAANENQPNIVVNVNVQQPAGGGYNRPTYPCPKCHVYNDFSAAFCMQCGKKLGGPPPGLMPPTHGPSAAPHAMFMPTDGMGVAAFPTAPPMPATGGSFLAKTLSAFGKKPANK